MTGQRRAYALALTAVLFWSTVASAFKLSLLHLTVVELVLYASLTSTAVLFLIVARRGFIGRLAGAASGQWLHSALLGFLNPYLYYLVLLHAYVLLPAQEAQPLNFVWPIVLVLISSVVLRQPLSMLTLAALVVSFAGVLVISTRGDVFGLRFTDALGVSLALGSSLPWALYWVLNLHQKQEPVVKLLMNFIFGSLYALVTAVVTGSMRWIPPDGLLGGIYVGLFEMGITFALWLQALKLSRSAAGVSNLVFLTPFLSLVFIALVVGETILLSTIMGAVLIVGGIVIQHVAQKKVDQGTAETRLSSEV